MQPECEEETKAEPINSIYKIYSNTIKKVTSTKYLGNTSATSAGACNKHELHEKGLSKHENGLSKHENSLVNMKRILL